MRRFVTRWFSVLAIGILSFTATSFVTADQAEEKREADRIRAAEQAASKAKQSAAEAEKDFVAANRKVQAADDRVAKAKAAYGRARLDAEKKLGESTGLPAVIREISGAEAEYERLAAPIRDRIRRSPEHAAAVASAQTAQEERQRLSDDSTLDDAALAAAITATGKLLRGPEELETAAIIADPQAGKAKQAVEAAIKRAVELREKVKSRIDEDAGVKKAQAEGVDATKDATALRANAAKLRATALRERSQAQQAANQVASVKAADRKDDANDKKKNNNKKNNNKKK